MNKVYKYSRISRSTQNIERQARNIDEFVTASPQLKDLPAVEVREVFTGTKQERPKWQALKEKAEKGDTIVFDSVSRMSRNAEDGVKEYMELFDRGVNLIFLKEAHINTDVYRQASKSNIKTVGDEVADVYITATNEVIKILAKRQIMLAFEQAEKEVKDLQKRTSEGIMTARLNGKRIGTEKGRKLNVKKAVVAKEIILMNSRDFLGSNSDKEVMAIAHISHNSLYKYKRELREELARK